MNACSLKDISNPNFNPFLNEADVYGDILDPWPIMAEKRRSSPATRESYVSVFGGHPDPSIDGRPQYTVWTYDTVREVLGDPTLFSSAIYHKVAVEPAFGKILVVMDPPDHTRYRRVLQAAFSPKAVKGWTENLIRPLIAEVIDDFADDGSADLVEQFTRRFTFETVFRLLDLPPSDVKLFNKLAVAQTFSTTPFRAEAREAGENLGDYFRCLLAERRKRPGEDMVSQLMNTEVEGERLEEEIVVSFLRHILNASADTSFRTTGSLLVALLTRPELMAEVRGDLSLVPQAIEETLRWEGPVNSNIRTLTRDHEIAGVRMEAGALIYTAQGSANRDEAYFENGHLFDLHRNATRHVGFGSGPHVCIGMHLARLQIREAVTALLTRLPNLRADPDAPPPAIRGFLFRTPPVLRVVF